MHHWPRTLDRNIPACALIRWPGAGREFHEFFGFATTRDPARENGPYCVRCCCRRGLGKKHLAPATAAHRALPDANGGAHLCILGRRQCDPVLFPLHGLADDPDTPGLPFPHYVRCGAATPAELPAG